MKGNWVILKTRPSLWKVPGDGINLAQNASQGFRPGFRIIPAVFSEKEIDTGFFPAVLRGAVFRKPPAALGIDVIRADSIEERCPLPSRLLEGRCPQVGL
jgi:hypothetical protein